jgi:hypothetical protein
VADWLRERGVRGGALHCDSRVCSLGDAFVAWPGQATDGRRYVPQALAGGRRGLSGGEPRVRNPTALMTTRASPRCRASRPHRRDCQRLLRQRRAQCSTWWPSRAPTERPPPRGGRHRLLSRLRQTLRCHRHARHGACEPGQTCPPLVPTGLTTPDPVMLQPGLRRFVDLGLSACAHGGLQSIGMVEAAGSTPRVRRGRVHQFHARPPRLPRQHGRLLAEPRPPLRWPDLRPRSGQHRRRLGRGSRRRHSPAGHAGRVDRLAARSPRARLQAQGLHYTDAAWPSRLAEGGAEPWPSTRCSTPLVGELQRQQPAGACWPGLRAGRAAGRRRRPCARAHARARPHAARPRPASRASGSGGGLRAHARCAGKGAAAPAPAGAQRAAPSVVRVRLRWRPRCRQAPADGCIAAGGGRHA